MNLQEIFNRVEREVSQAKLQYPGNKHRLLAFVEESGEVTKAFLDFSQGKCGRADIEMELIQAIGMAVRLLQEGDADFPKFKKGSEHDEKRLGVEL